MTSENLNDLNAFMAVARARSFTRAAGELGVSQSALSQTIRALEARLGIRLLTRTTRNVAPTEAGERLLAVIGPALEDIEAGLETLSELRDKPAGTVRITADEFAVGTVLWPAIKPFLAEYPDIRVELNTDYGLNEIVGERFDAGVRRGGLIAKDMIAMPISPDIRMFVVGSVEYFTVHSRPRKPQDLTSHNCINLRLPGGIFPWRFTKGGREISVRVEGQVVFSSILPILDAALAGCGLAYLPESMVQPHLDDGCLQAVLVEWAPNFGGYHLYYPNRRQASPAFALLVEALRYRR
ncbi:LysR family transcriptional regulator [Pseudomonas chengduensis]|uniref:DNA-binding transcriptional regulator, LysR family n=1 Tax=Pseudomonas sihuiensis TaxID=1274359 RepID=A0A1H2LSL0_9PSED|nr:MULTISPECIES: LysR family transcriptional regulator [Pseudomonas]MDH1684076.1 LysR family transcriptional regulator [Pseudomonas chengduensis]SDU84000.1 DNA-binding transcriptional regulator, LysR family [Pseudomonas sihuiensis]